VAQFPRPTSSQQLQSFLGMVNFYCRFLPSAAAVLRPLTDVLRGKKQPKLEWSPAMQSAFTKIKEMSSAAVELAHPYPRATLVLACDASDSHLGGVSQQRDGRGALRPLGFFSAKLDSTQVRYSTFDQELLACYLASVTSTGVWRGDRSAC